MLILNDRVIIILATFLLAVVWRPRQNGLVRAADLEPYCFKQIFNNKLLCTNFTSFRQLDFRELGDAVYAGVRLAPPRNLRLRLDSELSFEGLKLTPESGSVEIRNVFDIDFFYNPFLVLSNIWLEISIIDSQWQFSNMPTTLAFDPNEVYFMSDLKMNSFVIDLCQIISPIHSAIFKGSRIKEFVLTNLDLIKYDNENIDPSALNIEVDILETRYTLLDSNTLNSETLVNPRIFNKLKSLQIVATQLEHIDPQTLLDLTSLRTLKLVYVNLDELLKNGLDWMHSLNSNFNLDTAVIAGNLTLDDAFRFYLAVENLPQREEDICLFKDYPHSQFVLPLLLYSTTFENFQDILPCTCLVYWLYRDYQIYSSLFANLSAIDQDFANYIPFHCLSINPILYDEQIDYCQNRFQHQCDGTTASNTNTISSDDSSTSQISRLDSSTVTSLPPLVSCLDVVDSNSIYCRCSFEGIVNYLECSNSSINRVPDSLASQFDWDFVSFAGSSIANLRTSSFRDLRLKQNATLLVSNIDEFGTDIFKSSIFYDRQFRFVIANSSMLSLAGNLAFRATNFSELVIQNGNFDLVTIEVFDGAIVDKLIIDGAEPKSMSPYFKRALLEQVPQIRYMKISNVRDIFSVNSPIRKFVLDDLLLNPLLFADLIELEILNTRIDYILSASLSLLPNLRVVRLENVNLRSIIDHYFDEELPALADENLMIDYTDDRVNWLSNRNLDKVYLGRDRFELGDDDLCYFAGMSPNTTVYLYDNIDSAAGVQCTCTIYWIYRYIEFDRLGGDLDINYIPKCIQRLNNTENLLIKLVECLDGRNPTEYCKYLPEQYRTSDSSPPSSSSSSSSISSSMFGVTTTTASSFQTTPTSGTATTTATNTQTTTSAGPTTTSTTSELSSQTEMMRSTSSMSTSTTTSKVRGENQDDLDRISTMLLIVLIEFPVLALLNLVAIGLVIYILLKKKPTAASKVRPVDTRNLNLEGGNANYAFSSTYL